MKRNVALLTFFSVPPHTLFKIKIKKLKVLLKAKGI